MTRWLAIPTCLALILCVSAQDVEAVPTTSNITMRALDSGNPVNGSASVTVRLFSAATSGTMIYEETHAVTATNGLIYVDLGASGGGALDSTVFDGNDRWLEIVLNGTTMSPRLKVGVVPYAVRAAVADKANDADTVGGMPPSAFGDITSVTAGAGLTGGGASGNVALSADTSYMQRRVSGSCDVGSAIRIISNTGTVTCQDATPTLTCVNSSTGTGNVAPGNSAQVASGACSSGYVPISIQCGVSSHFVRLVSNGIAGAGGDCRAFNTGTTTYQLFATTRCCRLQ